MPNWSQVQDEIRCRVESGERISRTAFDRVRRKYLKRLHNHTGRNVIAYYSGFLSKPPNLLGLEVNDEDKNGLMMAIHQMDRSKGLDLILHTPGGSVAAAESLVDYLYRMFGNDIRAVVPQIAMSAGTMIACSCKSIVMATHSNLGPIDPQVNGLPAQGVLKEIREAYEDIRNDPEKIKVWQFVLNKYNPAFIGQCEQAIDWSKEFVKSRLTENMLCDDEDREQKAESIVDTLSNYTENKAHNRHVHIDACESMGLKIERLEGDQSLQDIILTVHHCFMNSLGNTSAIKIIENHNGVAFVKQAARQ